MRWVVAACAFALASSQNVLVVYTGDSADSTLSVAQAFAAGASRAGASTKLVLASEAAYDDVRDWADVVALGSGVINGNADPTLLEFLRYWSFSDDLSGQGFRAATVAAALARGRTPDKPANGSAAPPSFGDAWAGAVSANMTSAGYDAGLVIVNFTSACGDPAQQKMKTVYGDFYTVLTRCDLGLDACGCPFCVRDTNGSYAHPDASAGLADVLWDAPRAFSREGRRFTAHAGVAVAVGGSDDYSLKYDLAFDDDGHPAFVNISHPLWISTAARVDGFTRDVAGDAFDIPRGCFK
ncbi:hypothetical protein JL722_7646 [Aureococcus anophagefferens]|nr:hypothetical protein JL722_7646 [Aureococcus anophagefferens]